MRKFFSIFILILLIVRVFLWFCPKYQFCQSMVGGPIVRGNTITGEIDIYEKHYNIETKQEQLQKVLTSLPDDEFRFYLIARFIVRVIVIAALSGMLTVILKDKKAKEN
ncbi:MAG TPA: hypothetical protein ENH82_14600 [bacterium]|nr:hypothetical protein [bacterium]